jgi:hypothetical protein
LNISVEHGSPSELLISTHDGYFPGDVVICTLDTINLDQPLPYDALSYTWGNPLSVFESKEDAEKATATYANALCPIVCNSQVLNVGVNLYDALVRLRNVKRQPTFTLTELHPDLEARNALREHIWIDAICIDQGNVAERNSQVQMMDKIYETADTVFIWLGPEDIFSETALSLIETLNGVNSSTGKGFVLSEDLKSDQYEAIGLPYIAPWQWLCLFAFFDRHWFRRAWIIQEVALSKLGVVMCGESMFAWAALFKAANWMRESRCYPMIWRAGLWKSIELYTAFTHMYRTPDTLAIATTERNPVINVCAITDVRAGFGIVEPTGVFVNNNEAEPVTLLQLLARFGSAKCQDPRDKVYAFMNLLPGRHDLGTKSEILRVDYGLPVTQVYIDTCWSILGLLEDLRLLSYQKKGGVQRMPGLPSWVPDWSNTHGQAAFEDHLGMTYETENSSAVHQYSHQYCACADKRWQCDFEESLGSKFLHVQGKKVGTIRNVAQIVKGDLKQLLPVYNDIPVVYTSFRISPLQEDDKLQATQPGKNTRIAGDPANVLAERMGGLVVDRTQQSHPEQEPDHVSNSYFAALSSEAKPERSTRVISIYTQTRFEALWRTLISDSWAGQHPAPSAAGSAFVDSLIEGMRKMLARAQRLLAEDAGADLFGPNGFVSHFHDYTTALIDHNGKTSQEAFDADWRRRIVDLIIFAKDEQMCLGHLTNPEEGNNALSSSEPTTYLPHITTSADVLSYKVKDKLALQQWNLSQRDGQTLFSTSTHQIGLCPVPAEPGDEIWVLAGARFPLVLRKLDNGHHHLVGESYVHGIMHGEAIYLDPGGRFVDIVLE